MKFLIVINALVIPMNNAQALKYGKWNNSTGIVLRLKLEKIGLFFVIYLHNITI